MRWFRVYSELLDDPKQAAMSDRTFRIFILLLCIACEQDKDGRVELSEKEIAWRMRMDIRSVRSSLADLRELGIISPIDHGEIAKRSPRDRPNSLGEVFSNWQKRQFRSDDVSERVKRHRERKETEKETFHETLQETLVVTPPDTDTENNYKKRDLPPPSSSSNGGTPPADGIAPDLISFSRTFHKHQQARHPNLVKTVTEKKVKDGANAVLRLTRQGYDLESMIKPALRWAVADEFWSRQVLSLSGLLKLGKNGEPKFVNLLAQYEKEKLMNGRKCATGMPGGIEDFPI